MKSSLPAHCGTRTGSRVFGAISNCMIDLERSPLTMAETSIPMKRNTQLFRSCFATSTATLIVTLGLAACQSNSTSPSGQPAGRTGEARFNEVGKLSRNEASDYLGNQVFEGLDTNHDGRVAQEEWVSGDPSSLPEFKKRDADHDGVLTREEAIAYGRKHGVANKVLKEADKDGDGELSLAEVKAYYGDREGPVR